MTAVAAAPPRTRVRTVDLLWVLRHRHRTAIWISLAATILLSAAALVTELRLHGIAHCSLVDLACTSSFQGPARQGTWLLEIIAVAPAVFGVFAAAPMFPREFERGTHVLTAVSSVRPARWVHLQLLAVLAYSILLAAVLSLAATPLRLTLASSKSFPDLVATSWDGPLWSSGWLLVPHAVFACAAGLLAGALLRRSVPALALTAVTVGVLQLGAFAIVRPHWWPPLRAISRNLDTPALSPIGALVLSPDLVADAAGHHQRPFPISCLQPPSPPAAPGQLEQCLTSQGIAQRLAIYQPANRVIPFEWAEGGAFVLLSLGPLAGVNRLQRRDPPT